MLNLLRSCGFKLPSREDELSSLSKEQLMRRICDFWDRCNKYDDTEASEEFLELLANYPVSMCKREVSDELKTLVALFYFWYPPKLKSPDRKKAELMAKLSDRIAQEHLFSYEHLALIFSRSKATIHAAIKEKETEVRAWIEETNLRREARSMALEQLIEEEKQRLRQQQKKTKENKPNKRTNAFCHSGEVYNR